MKHIFFDILFLLLILQGFTQNNYNDEALNVVRRTFGNSISERVQFQYLDKPGNGFYKYEVNRNKLIVQGNSVVSLCRGFYDYIKTSNQGMLTWSGKNLNIRNKLKYIPSKSVRSPYKYHYYMNVVTHGYTTPYWDWKRWEQELDWMSLHGMDLLMLNGAYESIMWRVFKKIGMKDEEIRSFFTGPAFNPWNRMGNITGWDGPAPQSYYDKQISLTHKILERMRSLGIEPIVQSFAGFVPASLKRVYPEIELQELYWEGFEKEYRANILLPNNDLYRSIGKMFIDEWQQEFGKATYFIADSFNEMQVPGDDSLETALSDYGKTTYETIKAANPDAVWVLQGWTFPYFKDKQGRLFWTPGRLKAFLSKIPDEKILILDLGNEYNLLEWNIPPSWKTYDGFFNKSWVYSFAPNMGGKVPWNGDLRTYATAPIAALEYAKKGNLVGYGFAPEGIENNELVYELLADMGWSSTGIDIKEYIRNYCRLRYGSFPGAMATAYDHFLRSCYGSFNGHPRFAYQLSPDGLANGSVNRSADFFKGARLFAECSDLFRTSEYYKNDLIEITAQALSLYADSLIRMASGKSGKEKDTLLNKAYDKLQQADKLLQSHPDLRLSKWLNYAAGYGDDAMEKSYYTKNAKRIITRWGGHIRDYSSRMWGGLISSYYVQRLKASHEAERNNKKFDAAGWEDNWIANEQITDEAPFPDPVAVCKELIESF